jgi:hypothetical protein
MKLLLSQNADQLSADDSRREKSPIRMLGISSHDFLTRSAFMCVSWSARLLLMQGHGYNRFVELL